jgi:hypothetical protein
MKLKPLSPNQYRALEQLAAAGGWDTELSVTALPAAHKPVVWASLERRGLVTRASVSTAKWTMFRLDPGARIYLGADEDATAREAAAEKAMAGLRELMATANPVSTTYRKARTQLIAAIRTAYPALSATAIYSLWRTFMAPVRECADLARHDASPSL